MKPTDDLGTWAAAYREARRASPDLRARIAAAVERDAIAPDPVDDEAPRRDPPARWRTWAIAVGGGGLIAAAALLLLSWVVRWIDPEVVGTRAPLSAPYHHAPGDPEAATAAHGTAPASLPDAPSLPPVSSTPTPVDPPPTETRAPTRAPAITPAPPAATMTNEDLESLRRLRTAEQRLASDPADARAQLEAHARDYPTSAFALEREALWLRASCKSGHTTDVERRRTAFAKQPGVAVYATAIRRDCGR